MSERIALRFVHARLFSNFELDKKSGQTVLELSKLADIPLRMHRPIPDAAKLKEVTLKKEPTGEWFAIFGIEFDREPPEPPENPNNVVGIDVGILKYAHDTDGTAVGSLDLSDERERLEREQRTLSRKEYGSANWEKQRHQKSSISGWRTRRSRLVNANAWQSVTIRSNANAVTSSTNYRPTTLGSTISSL